MRYRLFQNSIDDKLIDVEVMSSYIIIVVIRLIIGTGLIAWNTITVVLYSGILQKADTIHDICSAERSSRYQKMTIWLA